MPSWSIATPGREPPRRLLAAYPTPACLIALLVPADFEAAFENKYLHKRHSASGIELNRTDCIQLLVAVEIARRHCWRRPNDQHWPSPQDLGPGGDTWRVPRERRETGIPIGTEPTWIRKRRLDLGLTTTSCCGRSSSVTPAARLTKAMAKEWASSSQRSRNSRRRSTSKGESSSSAASWLPEPHAAFVQIAGYYPTYGDPPSSFPYGRSASCRLTRSRERIVAPGDELRVAVSLCCAYNWRCLPRKVGASPIPALVERVSH